MNIIEKMTLTEQFSPLEKEIIDYIFSHRDEVLNMSINHLAKETYSSNTSIIRFCQKLNLNGFKEFKIAFAQALEQRRQNHRFVDYNYPFHALENPAELAQNIATLSVSSINTCCQELDKQTAFKAARLIEDSDHVFVYARGDSMIRAESFRNKLIKIGKYLTPTYAPEEMETYSASALPRDCALFISYSAAPQSYVRNAQILKRRGVPVITVTSNIKAALARLSTCVIGFANLEDMKNSIATFYSQIAIEYILNVLYSMIYAIHYQDNFDKKNYIDTLRTNPKSTKEY